MSSFAQNSLPGSRLGKSSAEESDTAALNGTGPSLVQKSELAISDTRVMVAASATQSKNLRAIPAKGTSEDESQRRGQC
jgi:hypothetical protein